MAYKIRNLLKEVSEDVWVEWRDKYDFYVPQYIKYAQIGGDWSSWPEDVLECYLSNDGNNPVSNIGMPQGKFSKEELTNLKNHWSEISPLLKKIAENQDAPRYDLYDQLINTIRPLCDLSRNCAMYRMIAALQPKLLTSIVNQNNLYELSKFLVNHTDADVKFQGSYFQISHSIQKLILETTNSTWEDVPTFAWQLRCLIVNLMEEYKNYKKKNEEVINLIRDYGQIILQGAPGTGKTFCTLELALLLCDAGEECFSSRQQMIEKYNELMNEKRIFFTTFHQSMDYEDFVEGYKPMVVDGVMTYEISKGIFRQAVDSAKQTTHNVVLIIDEINRGNISKIFGELISLLEKDKRSGKLVANLAYSKDLFTVPDNLVIIGTMNTTDRSTGTVDYALRRRFGFITIKANKDVLKIIEDETVRTKAEEMFDNVNKFLVETAIDDIDDLMVGHSYFLADTIEKLERKWNYGVLPLLEEYYKDGLTKIAYGKWSQEN